MDSEQKKVGGIGPSPNKVLLHIVEIQQFFCHFTQILHEVISLVNSEPQKNTALCSRIFQKVKIRENKGQKLIFEFDHSDCLAF